MALSPSLPIHDVADDRSTHSVTTSDRRSAFGVCDATDLVHIGLGEFGEAAAPHVYRVRDQLQMIRVDTSTIPAEMVDLLSLWDGSIRFLPEDSVRTLTHIVDGDHAVSVGVNHTLPLMASGIRGDSVVVLSSGVPVDEASALAANNWIPSGSSAARPDSDISSASALTKTLAHGYSLLNWQVEYTVTKGCVS